MDKRRGERKTSVTPKRSTGSRAASPLVGRDAEVRFLAERLDRAADWEGGTIFLTGQPGIGKTRLAREAVALAKERGFTALQGRAYPLGTGLAYAPILDAFGPYLRSLEPARLSALLKGLPDLGRLLGALPLPSPVLLPEGLADPALERTRLLETTLRLLVRLAKEAPVILYIDDLHWADSASLEMLHYLARGLSEQRALLLTTYSTGPLNMSHVLRALVVPLQRDELAEEIVVSGLGPEAVVRLARGFLGGEAPDDLLALLHGRAGGTPLFIEAFISSLVDSGNLVRDTSYGKDRWILNSGGAFVLPESIRHLVLERLARLAPSDRRIVDLIAVMGDGTSHDALCSASGMREKILLASLQRLRMAGLMAEGTNGQDVVYNLTHPLIQEVAYAELPEMARRRIHVAAIDAIESCKGGRPEDVNRLARHYRGAGPEADQNRALGVLLAAGNQARALYANQEAAQHYSAALAMVRQGYYSPDLVSSYLKDDPPLPWLLERLGEAWERLGEGGAAAALWKEALVLLSEGERAGSSDRRTVAASRLRSMLALVECERGQFEIANNHLRAGLASLVGHDARQEVADLHFERFYILDRIGDIAGMGETVAELQSVAEQLGSPRAAAEASLTTSIFRMWQNDLTGACEYALHAVELSETAQELAICCRAYRTLTSIGMRLGDHHFMRRHAKNALAVTQQLGAPSMEIRSRVLLAWAEFMAGAWDESRRISIEAIALARRVGWPRDLAYSIAGDALLLTLQGDLPAAEARIAEGKIAFGSPSGEGSADRAVFGRFEIAETALALERGEAERALSIARGFIRPAASALTERDPAGLTVTYTPIGLALLAEAQVATGDPEGALETAAELIGLRSTGSQYLTALACRAEGLARQALGQQEAAINCLTKAHETFAELEIPFEAARSLLELGAAASDVKPEVAISAAQESLTMFVRLGARRYAERARRLLRGLGISPPPPRRPYLSGSPLTEREIDIARLVAEGLTSVEIAKRLFLSRRTVTTHIEHIFARLGISSRSSLARYVVEAGLLLPSENT